MIMAGRGRRLTGEEQKPGKPADQSSPATSSGSDLSTLVALINEINVTAVNPALFPRIQSTVRDLFASKEAMRDMLSELHDKALADPQFGEKLVVTLEQVANFEIEGALLRNELLSFIQDDFKVKETLFQSDRKKFLNAVLLLGGVFNRIKICGNPIEILGIALLEYFDVLTKGDEEEFKILTKQIFINGEKLKKINRFELLEHDLRKIIINENLTIKCKCWILLAIDCISNGWKPLGGMVRNFYIANMGEEYKKLDSTIPRSQDSSNQPSNQPLASPKSVNSSETTPEKKNKANWSPSKTDNFHRDLTNTFSDLTVMSDRGNRERLPSKESNKKDSFKPRGQGTRRTGHDDRFDREENFYGVQKPRQAKPENQRRNFGEAKINKKGSDISKTDFGPMTEFQPASGAD